MTTTNNLICEAVPFYPADHLSFHYEALRPNAKHNSMLDTFKGNLTKAGIHWYTLTGTEEVKPLIRKIYPQADAICSATPEIKGNRDLSHMVNPYTLKDTDVTIVRSEFGVAQTGMVWIAEKSIPIRALKHITQHLVVLVHPDSLVRNMTEAYEEVYYNESNYGSFLLGYSDICSTVAKEKDKEATHPLSITVCFV